MLRLLLALALTLLCVLGPLPAPLAAAPVLDPREVQVDIAGRQRMLSQRMTAAACLVTLGVNPEQQRLALRESIELFEAGLTRLDTGYPLIGMPALADPLSRARLVVARTAWSQMAPLVSGIRDADAPPDAMRRVATLDPLLLGTAQLLVQSLHRDAQDTPDRQARINAVDMAGRQRMLAFVILKNTCLITREAADGADTGAHRQALETALDLFEISAGQLVAGDDEARIAPPPNDAATRALDTVQLLWQDMRPMLDPALAGEALGPARLGDLAYDYDRLLNALEDVVWSYTVQ